MHISKVKSLEWVNDLDKMEETREIVANWHYFYPNKDLETTVRTLDGLIAEIKAYQQSPAYEEYLLSTSGD